MISTIICSFCPNPHPSKYPTSSPRTIRSPRIFPLDQSIYIRALGTHLIFHHFTRRNSSNLYFRLHGLFSSARKRSTFRPLAERICVLYSCGKSICFSRLRNPSNLRPLDEKKLIEPFFDCRNCYRVLGTHRNSDRSKTNTSCKAYL